MIMMMMRLWWEESANTFTDLLLGLGDGLVQHEGEVLNLPFQEVVV